MCGVLPLHCLKYAAMQRYSPILEKAFIRDFMGQRVFEGVFDVGEETCLVEELCCLQTRQPSSQLV